MTDDEVNEIATDIYAICNGYYGPQAIERIRPRDAALAALFKEAQP